MTDTNNDHSPCLQVTTNPSAPQELQQLGQQYWEHKGSLENIKWVYKQNDLGFETWAARAAFAAGVGVTATITGHTCSECNGPLHCTSRTVAESVFKRSESAKCRQCTNDFENKVAQVLDPDYHARRVQIGEKKRQEQALAQERQRQKNQLEQQRQRVIDDINARHCDSSLDQLLDRASVLGKLGALLWTREDIEDTWLARLLIAKAWKEGLIKITSTASPLDFHWSADDPTTIVSVMNFWSPSFGHENKLMKKYEKQTLHNTVMPQIQAGQLTEQNVQDLQWLISHIILLEAESALESVSISWNTGTRRVTMSSNQQDDFDKLVVLAAETTSLRYILLAIQAGVHYCRYRLKDNPGRYRAWNHFENHALQQVIGNLQRLCNGDTWVENSKIPIDSHPLDSVTNFVFLHCLNMLPLATTTTPQAINDALSARTAQTKSAAQITLLFDPAVVSSVEDHANSNGSTFSEVIEDAIKSYLH
ncbi:hypothetical protein [Corynebacterium macclintockiae]|uniref:hypothetical protein n=1 Tax=Corynebacterium macclintockiae TaxID=2913501 RepID=UPI003EB9FECD